MYAFSKFVCLCVLQVAVTRSAAPSLALRRNFSVRDVASWLIPHGTLVATKATKTQRMVTRRLSSISIPAASPCPAQCSNAMTPSSHLWASAMISVLTANENLSSHLDLTQASLSVTSAVPCSLSAALFQRHSIIIPFF